MVRSIIESKTFEESSWMMKKQFDDLKKYLIKISRKLEYKKRVCTWSGKVWLFPELLTYGFYELLG